MRKYLILFTFLLAGYWIVSPFLKPEPLLPINDFGTLPILHGGRLKPMDSLARNSLLSIHSSQGIRNLDNEKIAPIEWFLDVITQPKKSDQYLLFKFTNPDKILQSYLTLDTSRKYFSYNEIMPHMDKISSQAEKALDVKADIRSPFQKDIVRLYSHLNTYIGLKNTFFIEGAYPFSLYIDSQINQIPEGKKAFQRYNSGETLSRDETQSLLFFNHYFKVNQFLSEAALGLPIPDGSDISNTNKWQTTGSVLLQLIASPSDDINVVRSYAGMMDAYTLKDPETMSSEISAITSFYKTSSFSLNKIYFESIFNRLELFYKSSVFYGVCLLLLLISVIRFEKVLLPICTTLFYTAFFSHTFGLIARMIIQGRPPVTNLYSSAVFVGWGAIVIAIILERISKNKLGLFTGSVIGFVTLIIAHHLSLASDTLEMMQAVLDTNLWLLTHVPIVTLGYSGTFIAGVYATFFILKGVLVPYFSSKDQQHIMKVTYGIICFSLLFSFVGTVLGGIWADQSWGRFWGWDPKENGALLIVLWNALMLHARLAGMIAVRGFMVMAVFGSIVTAFSYFGTNLLGVGLHSYGFTDNGFFWLMLYTCIHLFIIAIGLLPKKYWISHQYQDKTK